MFEEGFYQYKMDESYAKEIIEMEFTTLLKRLIPKN